MNAKVFKLNIYHNHRDVDSDSYSVAAPFVHMNPIYVNITAELEELVIQQMANCIIRLHQINNPSYNVNDDDNDDDDYGYYEKEPMKPIQFCVFTKENPDDETEIQVKCELDLVVAFLRLHPISIYQQRIGKWWSHFYLNFESTQNKGSDYTSNEVRQIVDNSFHLSNYC
jgi:hypothetical protein